MDILSRSTPSLTANGHFEISLEMSDVYTAIPQVIKPALKTAGDSNTQGEQTLPKAVTPDPSVHTTANVDKSRMPKRLPNRSLGVDRARAPVGA